MSGLQPQSTTKTCAFLTALVVACAALCPAPALATNLKPGGLSEFQVELPAELRRLAGRGQPSPVVHALVTIAVPKSFDPARDWPVMVISATSDPQYHSSRALLRAYVDTALGAGWILVAADPEEGVAVDQDEVLLRYALDTAALAVLKLQWPGADTAALSFGGFSGGAKYSGWLAAVFASQGRTIMGLYLAGINEDTVSRAARELGILSDNYRRVPIFLQSGEKDEIATTADHLRVYDDLKRAGFRNVRIEYFAGPHTVDPTPMRTALDWFRELTARSQGAR
jgi:predicted esterase